MIECGANTDGHCFETDSIRNIEKFLFGYTRLNIPKKKIFQRKKTRLKETKETGGKDWQKGAVDGRGDWKKAKVTGERGECKF